MSIRFSLSLFLFVAMVGCSSTQYKNQNPVGKLFPAVSGKALDGTEWKLPAQLPKRSVLILGYVQDSQFDIDRWLIGLDMTKTQVDVYEVPTIQGLFPRMFQTKIDDGMRKGIPKYLWKGVITVYSDGAKVQEFTGNERPRNARVLLVEKDGKVSFFHDGGFSVRHLNLLREKLGQ